MRAVCGLLAVLFVLGPIGMGMLFNADSPNIIEDAEPATYSDELLEDHGTRSAPSEGPAFVNLYLRNNNIMNTTPTSGGVLISTPGTTISFLLQNVLLNDYTIRNPSPGYPMVAKVTLGGTGDVTVTVRDNSGGTTVGSASLTGFSYGATPANVEINIPFSSGANYTFSKGNSIQIELAFTNTGRLYYNSESYRSRLQLYGATVKDITMRYSNFFGERTKLFYPYDIDFPEERKMTIMDGTISNVFGKQDGKYISNVQIQIQNGGMNETMDADYEWKDYKYEYTWNYPNGQTSGEYTVTTHVFDEQDNEFTIKSTFNMSAYGVVLTSPDTEPDSPEGTYKADAKRYVPLSNVTRYTINVWNVGDMATAMNISSTGPSGWDWWLEGDDIQVESDKKKGTIGSFDAGESRTFTLAVDSQSNPLGSQSTIVVTATCTADPRKDYDTINTISTVAQKYDLEMIFIDTQEKTAEEIVELGDEVEYNFRVTNTGGTNDTIWLDIVGNLPSGWTRVLKHKDGSNPKSSGGRYYVVLESLAHKDFTLTLTAPDSGEDDEFDLDIEGESQGSQSQSLIVTDEITLTTILTMGIELELETDGVQEVDPEDEVDFVFKISNTGTNSADYSVSYSTASGGFNSGDISFSETQFNNIAADDDDTFTMTVEPSADVEAGNHSITVRAVRNNDQDVYREITVYCIVTAIPSLELIEPSAANANLYGEGSPGDDVEYQISFKNTGNVDLTVNIAVSNLPEGWTVFFGNGSSVYSEEIIPGDTEEVDITFSIPDDAEGDETVDISISVIPSQGDSILIETHTKVEGSIGQTFLTLLVPILLFVVIIVMVVVIYRRR